MTKIVHCKKESYDVLIDRTTKWGNPFVIDENNSREYVIKKYETYLINEIKEGRIQKSELLELDGKTLGCWCRPKQCHGDSIISVINMIKLGLL